MICRMHHVPTIDHYTDPLFMQNREWFKEAMHLNDDGAHKYSKIVANEIVKLLNNIKLDSQD